MNATFTRKPTVSEYINADRASDKARELVAAHADEVGNSHEWPNRENVENTRTHLLAYIAALEARV